MFKQCGALRLAERKEADEGFREDVVVGDIEPGLATHFVFGVRGLGQIAKTTVGDGAQFVVVVEDHPRPCRVTPKFFNSKSPAKMFV